ncbi:molybdopterin molybdotransferase MoeA [Lentzea sp. NPDC092896]|uniref:molybdopterin molybdotransferase MoeA n=1 Tax=Lentzea sp. NPDC092896 TaxID=3364127 RepID=UPI003804CA04
MRVLQADVREVTWERARELAHQAPVPLTPRLVSLAEAAGLTLAADLCARTPLPAFDTSAMDGYAVGGPGPWQLVGRVRAGERGADLRSGEAVEISTGAQVPVGATAVLPVEDATVEGSAVHGLAGGHIRRTGEDCVAGAVLAAAGTRAGPALLGLAATGGHDELLVRPRPHVHVLVTGSELVHYGTSGDGRVRDALGPMLPSLITSLGADLAGFAHVPDEPGLLAEVLAGVTADVVVVTGSTSVGTTDQLRGLVDASGRWVVDTVACKPGHPQLVAELGGRWLVGLPGNPFAALVAAHTVLDSVLRGLTGAPLPVLPLVPVTGDVRAPAQGVRIVPVTWDGQVLAGHRAAFLGGAAGGAALAILPAGWRSGDPAPLLGL